MTFTKEKVILLIMYLMVFGVLFRLTLSLLFGPEIGYITLILLFGFVILLYVRCIMGSVPRAYLPVLIYITYAYLLVLLFPFLSEHGTLITAYIGFLNLTALLAFWLFMVSFLGVDLVRNKAGKVILIFGIINALGAVVQFFVSIDLFGLISNSVYTNEDVMSNSNVSKRAVSFISSPQSLSLFLAFCFCYTYVCEMKYSNMWRGLFLLAGGLTASKAFFVFLLVFFLLAFLSIQRLYKFVIAFSIIACLVFMFGDHLERVVRVTEILSNLEEYSAFQIWSESLTFALKMPDAILGNGIGVFSRGGQLFDDYILLFGSTESFFIQLLAEIGVIGVFCFLWLLTKSLINSFRYERKLFSIICGFCVVGLFTPSNYGYSVGIVFYYSIIVGLLCHLQKRIMCL